MSVESYLESIRKNTVNNSQKTAKLETTLKDLLNYETLKRAVAAGVENGSSEGMKRLEVLSQKILSSSDASVAELQETNALLREYFSKFSGGTASATSEEWIKALKEVLDEFGDNLPEKFQKRLQNDIAGIASNAGANGSDVLKELQDTQKSQTEILQAIYDDMKERQKIELRNAEASKPVELDEKRTNQNFWKFTMGSIKNLLTNILGKMNKGLGFLGALYVGLAIFGELKEKFQDMFRMVSSTLITGRISVIIKGLNKALEGNKAFQGLMRRLNANTVASRLRTATRKGQVFTGRVAQAGSTFSREMSSLAKSGARGTEALSLMSGAGKAVSGVFGFISKLLGTVRKVASVVSKIGSFPLKMFGTLAKVGRFGLTALKAVPLLGEVIMAVTTVFDFIQGFANTKGTIGQKVLGGFNNVFYQFFHSIALIPTWIIKTASKTIKRMINLFKTDWKTVAKNVGSAMLHMVKSIFSVLTLPISTALDEIARSLDPVKHPVVYGLITKASNLIKKFLPDEPTIARGGSTSGGSSASGGSSSPKSSGLGINIDSEVSSASGSGGTVETIPGAPGTPGKINKASGVILSSQSSDFIKRAGLTDRITSGMDGKHAGTASNPRSHYSGNKFDIGTTGYSSSRLAQTLKKLVNTPGLLEAHVEGPEGAWYSTYLAAINQLKREGVDTSKIGWWGSQYSSAKHIDVLIDPKQSGVAASSATGNTDSLVSKNPLMQQLQSQLTQAYNEQVALLNKVKAPDQLTANNLKATSDAIATQMKTNTTGDSITFNKKTDITDANLAALQLFQL